MPTTDVKEWDVQSRKLGTFISKESRVLTKELDFTDLEKLRESCNQSFVARLKEKTITEISSFSAFERLK